MQNSIGCALLLGSLLATASMAQSAPQRASAAPDATSRLEVAIDYSAVHAQDSSKNSFWLQGGSVQLDAQVWRGLGGVADITGEHSANINSTGVNLDMVIATFGPRYTLRPAHGRLALFGQALAGVANGFNGVFPSPNGAQETATRLALKLGGGANYSLSHRVAVRLIEADWLRTQLPNENSSVQNDVYLGAGLVLRFK